MELLYEKLCILKHTLILKKFQNIAKKILHCFSLFDVLYNCVKLRRLMMGDPVYTLFWIYLL